MRITIDSRHVPRHINISVLHRIGRMSPSAVHVLLANCTSLGTVVNSVGSKRVCHCLAGPYGSRRLLTIINHTARVTLACGPSRSTRRFSDSNGGRALLIVSRAGSLVRRVHGRFSGDCEILRTGNLRRTCSCLTGRSVNIYVASVGIDNRGVTPVVFALGRSTPRLIILMRARFRSTNLLVSLVGGNRICHYLPGPVHTDLLRVDIGHTFRRRAGLGTDPRLIGHCRIRRSPRGSIHVSLDDHMHDLVNGLHGHFSLWTWGRLFRGAGPLFRLRMRIFCYTLFSKIFSVLFSWALRHTALDKWLYRPVWGTDPFGACSVWGGGRVEGGRTDHFFERESVF